MRANAERMRAPRQQIDEYVKRQTTRDNQTDEMEDGLHGQARILHENSAQSPRGGVGVIGNQRQATNAFQNFSKQTLGGGVGRQKRKIPSAAS